MRRDEDATLGDARRVASQGWYAYAGWKFAPKWTLQVGYSRNELRDPGALGAVASSVNSTLQAAHVTLWWDVARNYPSGMRWPQTSGDRHRVRLRLRGIALTLLAVYELRAPVAEVRAGGGTALEPDGVRHVRRPHA